MLRAAIYARCSTEEESQKYALVKQVAEAEECVRHNGWALVDSYVESKSGTSTKGRAEYNRLYEDLLYNKFDIIVIKSQDRLMRNVKDWYLFLDRLTTQQKKLFLYIENKFYSADDALIAGVKAILAEDYSRELSKKINNSHRNRQKHNGKPVLTSNVYGIRKAADGSLELIPEEAKNKVRMYELCAAGYGSRTICTILKNEGVVNRKGIPFTASNIVRMIKNPLNKGTIVMNRSHYDFDSKKTLKVPEEEWYVYENKVPAIVSEELWELANAQIQKRTSAKGRPATAYYGKNPGKYHLSRKLVCGNCGATYYRRSRKRYKNKTPIYTWMCKNYLETGRNAGELNRPQVRKVEPKTLTGCDNVHLDEEKLNDLLAEICEGRYKTNKEQLIKNMLQVLRTVLKEKDLQPEINHEFYKKERLKDQMDTLLDKLLNGVISDDVYQRKQQQLEKEILGSQKRIEELELRKAQGSVLTERISHIEQVLKNGQLIEKATVAGMLEEISYIEVFPKCLKLHFSYSKMLGINTREITETSDEEVVVIECGNLFNYREQQKDNLQMVVDRMKENPQITAKEIATEMGITTSGVQQRITRLRKENRIRFVGKGGKGYWEVLEE